MKRKMDLIEKELESEKEGSGRSVSDSDDEESRIKDVLGLVHTMPDKFENATLLLRLGLPSTLQRTNPHKKIRENGTF